MGGCSVDGCKNRFSKKKLHFFRFPRNDVARQKIWIDFTGRNFTPKPSSTICEVHFPKKFFIEKKNRVHLHKDAVPMYIKDHPEEERNAGSRIIDHSCEDPNNQESFEKITFDSYNDDKKLSEMIDDENLIMIRKKVRCVELKKLCQFCFNSPDKNDSKKCIETSRLHAYNIKIEEINNIIGIQSNEEVQSGLLCESCFMSIVEFDSFRKKCIDAQNDIWNEFQDIDEKLNEVRGQKSNEKCDENLESSNFEMLEEEHLEEAQLIVTYNPVYDGNQIVCHEETDEKYPEGFQIVYQHHSESVKDALGAAESLDRCQAFNVELYDEKHKDNNMQNSINGIDEYTNTEQIINNPEGSRFFKIYVCFFCKLKFAGRKTYTSHKCKISEVQCDHCEKVFNRIQSFNSHVSHVHGSLPISKHFCPLCKTFIYLTNNQFKQHKRSCNKEIRNLPIECEVCSKVCNSLKGYSIHKIFHETRNFSSEGLNSKRTTICELCGKNFQSAVGYRMHRRNVHRVGQKQENFQCNICPKSCPTRRSLFDHMRNTHRIQESPCLICGKVFRTKILLKKHMMYHDESKRVFKCKFCPDKSYFTNVALKRHEKSHLGTKDFTCELCDASYSTNQQLKNHRSGSHRSCFN